VEAACVLAYLHLNFSVRQWTRKTIKVQSMQHRINHGKKVQTIQHPVNHVPLKKMLKSLVLVILIVAKDGVKLLKNVEKKYLNAVELLEISKTTDASHSSSQTQDGSQPQISRAAEGSQPSVSTRETLEHKA
jgi:hypothetical protein